MEKAGFPRMAYGSIVLDLNLFYFVAFNIWFSGLLHCPKKKKKFQSRLPALYSWIQVKFTGLLKKFIY